MAHLNFTNKKRASHRVMTARFNRRKIYTGPVCKENTRLLFELARRHVVKQEWTEALAILVRRLWKLFPPCRLERICVDEMAGKCALALGYFETASAFFFRACVNFNINNPQSCDYYRANIARLLFYASVASFCGNRKIKRSLSYLNHAKTLLESPSKQQVEPFLLFLFFVLYQAHNFKSSFLFSLVNLV